MSFMSIQVSTHAYACIMPTTSSLISNICCELSLVTTCLKYRQFHFKFIINIDTVEFAERSFTNNSGRSDSYISLGDVSKSYSAPSSYMFSISTLSIFVARAMIAAIPGCLPP